MHGSPQDIVIVLAAAITGLLAGLLIHYACSLRGRKKSKVDETGQSLSEAYLSTIHLLVTAIDSKDSYTRTHSARVQEMATAIARQMGVSSSEAEGIKTAALVHDIGKIGIPEHILKKPGRLSPDEYAILKEHPVIGSQMLKAVTFPWPIADIVKSHHERWDGAGYPDRLLGKDIPLGARILAVADVFDAMTSDRSYRNRLSVGEAVEHISKMAGSHFDPAVVNALKSVVKKTLKTVCTPAEISRPVVNEEEKLVSPAEREPMLRQVDMKEVADCKLSPRDTLSLIAGKIRSVFDADSCVIYLRDDVGSVRLVSHGMSGVNSQFFEGASTQDGDGLTGGVTSSGRAYAGQYDKSDVMLTAGIDQWVELESCGAAPVSRGGSIIGCINIYSCKADAFDHRHSAALAQIASQTAGAIERAWMQVRAEKSTGMSASTGLMNEDSLINYLQKTLISSEYVSIFRVNVNGLHSITETLGLPSKEQLVQAIGRLIRNNLPEGSSISRSSDNAFIAAAPGVPREQAQKMAKHMEQQFRVYSRSGRFPDNCFPEISIGTASSPGEGSSAEELLESAEKRLQDVQAEKIRSTV